MVCKTRRASRNQKYEDAIKKLNDDFDEALKELRATYENQEERDSGIKKHKPLGMLKSIKLGGEKSDL